MLTEELNTEGMDEAEASLLQRQREVAIKRVRTVYNWGQTRCVFGIVLLVFASGFTNAKVLIL